MFVNSFMFIIFFNVMFIIIYNFINIKKRGINPLDFGGEIKIIQGRCNG